MSEREELELGLREWLDDDDAVTCVQVMLARGWLPPSELAAVRQELAEARQRSEQDVASALHYKSCWQQALGAKSDVEAALRDTRQALTKARNEIAAWQRYAKNRNMGAAKTHARLLVEIDAALAAAGDAERPTASEHDPAYDDPEGHGEGRDKPWEQS